MPRDNSGVAHPTPGAFATANTVIRSQQHQNVPLTDIYNLFNTQWPEELGGTGSTSIHLAIQKNRPAFDTFSDLISDETISYIGGSGQIEVEPGSIIEAQGFRYEVVESDAADFHAETSGGVKLKLLALPSDGYNPIGLAAPSDGIADATTEISIIDDLGGGVVGRGARYSTSLSVLSGEWSGFGRIGLASPPRAFQPQIAEGYVLPYPQTLLDKWATPPLKVVRRNGQWTTDKNVRSLVPEPTGETYYVDIEPRNSSSADGRMFSITAISNTSPAVVTHEGVSPIEGGYVYITGIEAMSWVHTDRYYQVTNVNDVDNTFELNSVDFTGLPAYGGGGSFVQPPPRISIPDVKSDVGEILIAPGHYPSTYGTFSANAGNPTSSPSIIVRPWQIRAGRPILSGADQTLEGQWSRDVDHDQVWSASTTSVPYRIFDLTMGSVEDGFYEYYRWTGGTLEQRRSRVASRPGSWASDGNTIYVHPLADGEMSFKRIAIATHSPNEIDSNKWWHFEGIDFAFGFNGLRLRHDDANRRGASFVDCSFSHNTRENGLFIQGAYDVYVEDCYAGDTFLDGFNYHDWPIGDMPVVRAFEIRARTRRIGRTSGGSNNGSTMHDGGVIIRIDCDHGPCGGPVYADINASETLNVGCGQYGGSSLPLFGDSNATFYCEGGNMYLIDCDPGESRSSISVTNGATAYLLNTEPRNQVLQAGGGQVVPYL